jgi:hypothetical protein
MAPLLVLSVELPRTRPQTGRAIRAHVNDEESRLGLKSLKTSLSNWFDDRQWQHVRLTHNEAPEDDPYSYRVVYEATFAPESPAAANVEIWLTDADQVAVGIDSCERVAQKLGVRNQRTGFAGGHEPLALPTDALLALLELVARGDMWIRPSVVPVVGLVAAKAVVTTDSYAQLCARQYPTAHWLDVVDVASGDKRLVTFAPWD